jgi:PAS domain S-box-containing protein
MTSEWSEYPERQGDVHPARTVGFSRIVAWARDLLRRDGADRERIEQLERALAASKAALGRTEATLRRTHRLSKLCHWRWDPIGEGGGEERGTYTYTDEAEGLLGHSIADLTTIKDFFSQTVVHPDDRAGYLAAYYRFWNDSLATYAQEYRIIHATFGVRHIRETAEKHFDATGRMTVMAGTLQDITDTRAAELAQKRSEAMLRRVHRMVKLCHWHWEPGSLSDREGDGHYYYSDEISDVFGLDATIIDIPAAEFARRVIHPDDQARCVERYARFWSGLDLAYVLDYRIVHPQRGIRYVRESAERVLDDYGRVQQVAGTMQDITDEHAAALAMRENEIKLSRGFRMAKLAHWTFEPEARRPDGELGVYTYSEGVSEIHGVDAHTLHQLGDTFYEKVIHPDDREELKRLNDEFNADDKTTYTHEYRILRPDHSIRYVRESAEKLRDEHGKVTQIIGTIQDVTDQRLAGLALSESEAKLRRGFRMAELCHWTCDLNKRRTDGGHGSYTYSEEAAEIFGVSTAELDRTDTDFWSLFVHPEDRDEANRTYAAFLEGKTPSYADEFRVVRPNGEIRFVREVADKLYGPDGKAVQIVGIIQDMTELKRSELSLRRIEAQLQRAYRLAKLGYWYWEASESGIGMEDGGYRFSGDVFDITGLQPDGHDWTNNRRFCDQHVHPDDRELVYQTFASFSDGTTDIYTLNYRFLHPDGVTRYFRSSAERVRDERGRILYVTGIIQDITEVKASEIILRRSELQLRRAQRIAKLYCWHVDIDPATGHTEHRVDSEMATELAHCSLEDLSVSNAEYLTRFVHPDDRRDLSVVYAPFERGETDFYVADYRMLRPDGSSVPVRSMVERIRNEAGQAVQIIGAIQDVTDQRQREAELIEAKNEAEIANRSKSEFLANMSHELRTPLNAIIGFSEIIRDQRFEPVPPRYVEYARDIYDSGEMLLTLIKDVLDMSKLEAGKQTLHEELTLPGDAIESCVTMIKERAAKGQVTLTIKQTQAPPEIWVDEQAIKQVLLNLLSNAVKFTPAGGSVTIRPGLNAQGEFEIAIVDTGIGIPSDVLPQLFAPFQRGDNRVSRQFQGTGLGLAISRRLMELHQGRIEIDSTPGKGTKVAMILPAERVVHAEPTEVAAAANLRIGKF